MAAVFGHIYRRRLWGAAGSVSGAGSTVSRAADFIDELLALLRQFEVRTTTFITRQHHREISTGGWRALNLQQAPFFLPPPLALVDEKCTHSGGMYPDKRLALWSLQQLP